MDFLGTASRTERIRWFFDRGYIIIHTEQTYCWNEEMVRRGQGVIGTN